MLRLSPVIVTVSRKHFMLTLWKMRGNKYKRIDKYGIAVGAIGHTTPSGLYLVNGKSYKPDWKAPDADWVAPENRGKIFHIDNPLNPFAGGFISIGDEGVGIHGTKFDPKIGTRASHGCIRMRVKDFSEIYGRVPKHTPVFIY